MSDTRLGTIILIGMVVIMAIVGVDSALQMERDKVFAAKGLEECPYDINSIVTKTIWVKNCNEYMSTVNAEGAKDE